MDVWRSTPRVLLVCPVNVRQPPPSCRFAYSFDGGAAKAPACAKHYRAEADALGVAFLDANEATQIPDPRHGGDGIHLSAQNCADSVPPSRRRSGACLLGELRRDGARRRGLIAEYSSLPVAGGKSPRISQTARKCAHCAGLPSRREVVGRTLKFVHAPQSESHGSCSSGRRPRPGATPVDGHALPDGGGRLGPREVGVEPDLVDVRPAPRLVARVPVLQ